MGALVRLGLRYGVLAFATGFMFGLARELVLAPKFGAHLAQQIEFPLVTASVFAIGCWLERMLAPGQSRPWLLGLGLIGVATLLVIEGIFALAILKQPLETYLQSFNLAAGSLFPIGLAIMALAPLFSRMMQRSG
ncbi:MAG: hypothetical protein KDJ55_04125 [Rhodobiaceae bacterium]|nr:hypothetical protein [Rhodobiaceae bacterium]MCC0018931.1 hypothetical protein [Rhodobiaceae bacterium]MCC0060025.1 hypothetical protein [Rhodobiaceae bacterium]